MNKNHGDFFKKETKDILNQLCDDFEEADKVRQMALSVVNGVAKNDEVMSSIQHSDDQNARITSDKIAQEEFNAMVFGMAIKTGQ